MSEVWKSVSGYEGSYEVSSLGNVRSLDRKVPSKYGKTRITRGVDMKLSSDKDGYKVVSLKRNQKGYKARVHRLVCQAFIDNPDGKPQVNHINGIKSDNRVENLEWCTLSENRRHAYETGLQNGKARQGSLCNFTKLTEQDVLDIRAKYSGDSRGMTPEQLSHRNTMNDLADEYGVTYGAIQCIISKRNWKWL